MVDLVSVQQRGMALFERLLESESRGNQVVDQSSNRPFSWFNLHDADNATTLAFRFSALVSTADEEVDGLDAAIAAAEHEAIAGDPALVRQALSMFVTHNLAGRKLIKPRTAAGAPGLFVKSPRRRRSPFAVSEGGASPELDYWREDTLANEHHEHWHQVYPFTGLPVKDFNQWVIDTGIDRMVDILNALQPNPDWRNQVENASTTQLADFFAGIQIDGVHRRLPAPLRGLFNKANDRHGELFVYMHAQMLARYDAELLSHGLDRVEPFGPSAWSNIIPSGHNPIGLPFGRRLPSRFIPADFQDQMEALLDPIEEALAAGSVFKANGESVEITPVLLGEMIEAAAPWTTELDTGLYRGLHNTGHGILSSLTESGSGVMASTVVAIRDPIFWRWHKFIDNLAASWQDNQTPYDLSDQPQVMVRNALPTAATDSLPWSSPDIILVNSDSLPIDQDPEAVGEALLGGAAWDIAPDAVTGAGDNAITDALTTMMVPLQTANGPAPFLSHQPFGYFLRLENTATVTSEITVRLFLAPSAIAEDRRAWIEMDKFHISVPAQTRKVIYRADTESSVIKKPAERSPAEITLPDASADETGYCDCGWPWTLLLPRGSANGTEFKLIALCTDWHADQVGEPGHCGSMSFCGALDKYPDQRDMGYPFCRPFAESIEDVVTTLHAAAGRRLVIRHV